MDGIIIASAVILAVIAVIEILTILFSLPSEDAPPYVTVLPVFREDRNFSARLEYILKKSCGRTNIIIVDYSADDEQRKLCSQFVRDNPDAVLIFHYELEKYFAETFAIYKKI